MTPERQQQIYDALKASLENTKRGTKKFGELREIVNCHKNGAKWVNGVVDFNPWPKKLIDRLENLIKEKEDV